MATESSMVKVCIIGSGKTNETDMEFFNILRNRIKSLRIKKVPTVDESDIVLVFCPVVSSAGTDIEAALKRFDESTDSKLNVLVVLHHTFDPEKTVLDSRRCVNREDILTVDCLFYEDTGLLKCQKNHVAMDKVVNWLIKKGKEKGAKVCPRKISQVTDQKQNQDGEQNIKAESDTANADMNMGIKSNTKSLKLFSILAGKTNNCHKGFIDTLKNRIQDLKEDSSVDESDIVLVFCPIVSRAGTDIETALKRFNVSTASKLKVLVVLHHTFDPEKTVLDRSTCVNREDILTVDCLFYEDTGLLKCQKNDEAMDKVVNWLIKKSGDSRDSKQRTGMSLKSGQKDDESQHRQQPQTTAKNETLQKGRTHNASSDNSQSSSFCEVKVWLCSAGATRGNEYYFIADVFRLRPTLTMVATEQESDVVLYFRPVVSQTDCDAALQVECSKITDKPLVVILLHHTIDPDTASVTRSQYRSDMIVVDCLFHGGVGLTQCRRYDAAVSAVSQWLSNKGEVKSKAERNRKQSTQESENAVSGETAPVLVPGSELRLVLLGCSGSEKSAAGNIILGREEKSQTDTSTETQQSESRQGEVDGKQVTVVETPDWFCSGLSLEEVRQDVGRCVRLSAPGPHAFLLVIPVQQSTEEKIVMLEKMEEIFGERCWRNTMILFTATDEEQRMNIKAFVQSGNHGVQRLVQKCGNQFHCLNIHQSANGSQVSELLEKIEKMVDGNPERFYSSEIYLEIETQIRAMERKIMRDREEKKEMEEREMKEKIEKEVQNSLRKIGGVIEEHEGDIKQLNERTCELERQMKEERDEEKKKELKRELKKEMQRRTELEREINRLKDQREKEKSEMEERHRQEMEQIRQMYEGEIRVEAERDFMKIILPELQRNILDSKSKMQQEFIRQMEEKNREVETLKKNLLELKYHLSIVWDRYKSTMKRNPV